MTEQRKLRGLAARSEEKRREIQTKGGSAVSSKPRGFAAMSPEKQREIAAKGGKALRPEQRSFSKDRSLASAAGLKGGEASVASKSKGRG